MMTALKYLGLFLAIGFAGWMLMVLLFVRLATNTRGYLPINKNLSKQFWRKDGKVFYCMGGNFFNVGAREIAGVDPDSFKVLSSHFARDNHAAYCLDRRIAGSDPESFEVLSDFYARDKHNAYLYDNAITQAHAATFSFISHNYAKDKNHAFYAGKLIHDSDPKNIKYLFGSYAMDARHVYFENHDVVAYKNEYTVGAVPGDTEQRFIKIDNKIYAGIALLDIREPNTLEVSGNHYLRDSVHVYYFYRELVVFENSDPAGFRIIDDYYAKDGKNVYYLGMTVEGIDPSHFKAGRYSDRKYYHARLTGNRVRLIPRKDVTPIGQYAYLYEGEVYAQNNRVAGADTASFAEIVHPYYRDKNHVYYFDQRLLDADPAHFHLLEGDFATDDRHVYFNGLQLVDVSPAEFTFRKGMYANAMDDSGKGRLALPHE